MSPWAAEPMKSKIALRLLKLSASAVLHNTKLFAAAEMSAGSPLLFADRPITEHAPLSRKAALLMELVFGSAAPKTRHRADVMSYCRRAIWSGRSWTPVASGHENRFPTEELAFSSAKVITAVALMFVRRTMFPS